MKPRPDLTFERRHIKASRACVGVDEVGRGCLAGPVVTAAVVLPEFVLASDIVRERKRLGARAAFDPDRWWLWLNDSKLLGAPLRKKLSELLLMTSEVQIAWCLPDEIDRWNILHASLIAMRRALWPFSGRAQAVLVDGNQSPFDTRFRCPRGEAESLGFTHVETIVKGDSRSLSIAAASVVAKVYRDEWMTQLESLFPGYGFADHKGYSTPAHYAGLEKLGPCSLHRRSFEPIRSAICKQQSADC